MDVNRRSLRSDFIRYTTATIASLMVFSLYSIVDGLFVSHGVGEYAMTAVNLSLPYTNVLFSIAVIFAVGTSTIVSIYLGEGKGERANSLFSQNFCVLLTIGLVVTVFVLCLAEPLARLLGAEGTILPYAVDYLTGLAPFSVCCIISYNLEILIKTDGFPRLALITVIIGCLTNCVLDYLAIFVLDLGIWGAATATGISQLVTCVIYLRHFLGRRSTFHLTRFRFDAKIYRRLIPIGISDGVTELCNGLMIFLFNRTILRCIGEDGLVSYTVIAYLNTLIINVLMGISQGMQPLVSFQYGRRDSSKIRTLLRYGLLTTAAVTVVFLLAIYLFTLQIVTVFLGADNLTLNAQTVSALHRYALCYLLLGGNVLIGGFLAAVERPRGAITISVGRGFAVQSVCLLLLAAACGGSAIWFAPAISELLCCLLSILFLRRFWNAVDFRQ